MKKYELTEESIICFGTTLHRIRALKSFGDVQAGDIGGFVESKTNLDDTGNAWVSGNARVYGDAQVSGNTQVYGNARVSGDAWVYSKARGSGNAQVYGDSDYVVAKGFGSKFRATSFFRLTGGGIGVQCGCFYGTLDDFRNKVRETYPDDKKGKEYLMLADLIDFHFNKGDETGAEIKAE